MKCTICLQIVLKLLKNIEYVEEVIQPVEESLEELHYKADQLLPKKKRLSNH